MANQRQLRRIILGMSGFVFACIAISVAAFALRPPSFASRVAAITYTINQQGTPVELVIIDRGWPDQINSSTYTTSLRVRTREYGEIGGRYECRNGETSCWVAVPKLHIDMVPVPDLSKPVDHPLLIWLQQQYAMLRINIEALNH